jgi:hypothetical protein
MSAQAETRQIVPFYSRKTAADKSKVGNAIIEMVGGARFELATPAV